jgi:DNA-binding HxlR family transcriptional regulator
LAADGIVVRTAYPQVPPKVEYFHEIFGLTDNGNLT